jgi:four helix bundle protein
LNIQHRTSNVDHCRAGFSTLAYLGEREMAMAVKQQRVNWDLSERLLEFSARIIRLKDSLPSTRTGNHVAGQLLGCGTSPYPNHGEAQSAESQKDFIHKMKVCLKELRETERWIRLIVRVPLVSAPKRLEQLRSETDELIRIFVTSINTATKNLDQTRRKRMPRS